MSAEFNIKGSDHCSSCRDILYIHWLIISLHVSHKLKAVTHVKAMLIPLQLRLQEPTLSLEQRKTTKKQRWSKASGCYFNMFSLWKHLLERLFLCLLWYFQNQKIIWWRLFKSVWMLLSNNKEKFEWERKSFKTPLYWYEHLIDSVYMNNIVLCTYSIISQWRITCCITMVILK